jgi:acyl-CoA hydrolase
MIIKWARYFDTGILIKAFPYINFIVPVRVGGETCVLGYIMYADERSSSKKIGVNKLNRV